MTIYYAWFGAIRSELAPSNEICSLIIKTSDLSWAAYELGIRLERRGYKFQEAVKRLSAGETIFHERYGYRITTEFIGHPRPRLIFPEVPCVLCKEMKPRDSYGRTPLGYWCATCKQCKIELARTTQWAARSRRRARLRNADAEHFNSENLKGFWIAKRMNVCVYCGNPWQHADHFIPVALGGSHSMWNLVPACEACNLSKNDTHPRDWIAVQFPDRPNLYREIAASLAA